MPEASGRIVAAARCTTMPDMSLPPPLAQAADTGATSPISAHQCADYRPPPDEGLAVVHHDAHGLVVLKPAGLLTVPGRGERMADCLIARVQQRFPEALIVHRLDMDTSGLVLLALGPQAQRDFSGLFMHRQIDKRYEAVVHGLVQADEGQIDAPLITDWPRRPRQCVDPVNGKPSLTRFQVLSRDLQAGTTRLRLEPVTGRSHQLRVHLLHHGHPILGDPLYGHEASQSAAPRLLLHATSLSFEHPHSSLRLTLHAPAPF